jgi:nitrite reductase/ring-hydroxylating ferredoxin subunit
MNRRSVLGAGAVICSLVVLDRWFTTEADAEDSGLSSMSSSSKTNEAELIDLGPVGNFGKPGVYDVHAKRHKVLVLVSKERIAVSTSICTHKRCGLKVNQGTLKCPCHGSEFDNDGIPIDGPAKVSLVRFGVSLGEAMRGEDGADIPGTQRLRVDLSKSFAERQWEQDGAWVKRPA